MHLYIDDFGTGYSSLSYLQMLPVDGLKLAQEFVEALPGTDSESGLVRTIRDLAETLGLAAVVAEGIERPEQWRSLLSLGYSVGQGFHLAVPMPADRIPDFLSGLERPGDGDWERRTRGGDAGRARRHPVRRGPSPTDAGRSSTPLTGPGLGAFRCALRADGSLAAASGSVGTPSSGQVDLLQLPAHRADEQPGGQAEDGDDEEAEDARADLAVVVRPHR